MNGLKFCLITATLVYLVPSLASAQEVINRERNQQGRIAQGIGSGQITAHGATRLEQRETNINASRRGDLAANGGRLTPAEMTNLNRRQNSVSRQIYIDKHDGVAQPGVVPR